MSGPIEAVCKDCHSPFLIEEGEQRFFAERPELTLPKRCKPCRLEKKALRNAETRRSQAG